MKTRLGLIALLGLSLAGPGIAEDDVKTRPDGSEPKKAGVSAPKVPGGAARTPRMVRALPAPQRGKPVDALYLDQNAFTYATVNLAGWRSGFDRACNGVYKRGHDGRSPFIYRVGELPRGPDGKIEEGFAKRLEVVHKYIERMNGAYLASQEKKDENREVAAKE